MQPIVLYANGVLINEYDPKTLPLIQAMPGAKYHAEQEVWTVSLKPGDRKRLQEICERLDVKVTREFFSDEPSRQARHAAGLGLFPFQLTGVDWLSKRHRALLGDDMGLGKTVQALTALNGTCGAIVVCPNAVKYNWAEEAARWRTDMTVHVVRNATEWRLPASGEIVIANFEVLPVVRKRNAATLIVDEAHRVKSLTAKRSKRVRALSKVCNRTWGLTGTPLLNRPMDLWGVLHNLNLSEETFGTFTKFVKLFNGHRTPSGRYVFKDATPIVPEMLRRTMLRRLRGDVLPELPEKLYYKLTLRDSDLDPKVMRELDRMWSAYGSDLRAGKLPPFEKFSEVRETMARLRIPAMLRYVDENRHPLLVFSAHKAPLAALAARDGWDIISGDTDAAERQRIVKDFQAGKLQGVGLSIQAGGVGLTLTKAAQVLFVDLDWVPANNTQAEDRVCRIGQQADNVHIIRMTSNHPLDKHVTKVIARKMYLIDTAVEQQFIPEVHGVIPKKNKPQRKRRTPKKQTLFTRMLNLIGV
jgi:SNF2 family DNA or RNA helicase